MKLLILRSRNWALFESASASSSYISSNPNTNSKMNTNLIMTSLFFSLIFLILISTTTTVDGMHTNHNHKNRRDQNHHHNDQAVNVSALRRFFEEKLELENTASSSVSDIKHTPHYVENLYRKMVDVLEPEQRNVFFPSIKDGLFTVQAIGQEERITSVIGQNSDESESTLKFALKKLWVKPEDVGRAVLILEVHRHALPRSSGSGPARHHHHVINVLSSHWSTEPDDYLLATRRLVAADLRRHEIDDGGHLFVRFDLTDAVKTALNRSGQQQQQTTPPHGGVGSSDHDSTNHFNVRLKLYESTETSAVQLNSTLVSKLFHTTSRGRSQPLLVLYSREMTPVSDQSFFETARRRFKKRAASDDDDRSSWNGENNDSTRSRNCGLVDFTVDLEEVLINRIFEPKHVNVKFCDGLCPLPLYDSHLNASNNAVIRSNFNENRRRNPEAYQNYWPGRVPDPVCVPRTFNPTAFLFSGESNSFVYKLLEQVVATSCMCA